MSTPVKPSGSSVPAVPAAPGAPLEPVPVVAPFGWALILSASIGLLLATWLLYPLDADGMWAGYHDGFIATITIVCALALNSTLPKRPFVAVTGLCGVLLVLFGVFLDNPTKVVLPEIIAGAVLIAGAALYASGHRD